MKSKNMQPGKKTTEQWIDEYLREERTKAISSRENFIAYLKGMYEAGDIIPDPENADSVMVNWRGILDDLWEMARQLGGDHPPPMPRVEREAEAKSAIDLLLAWSAATATGTKLQESEQTDPATRAIALLLDADRNGRKVTKKKLALAVGCHRATLDRDPQFAAAWNAVKAKNAASVPHGIKNANGNMEAEYDPDED